MNPSPHCFEEASTMVSPPKMHQSSGDSPGTYPICTGSCIESVEELLVSLDNIACETRLLINMIDEAAFPGKDVFEKRDTFSDSSRLGLATLARSYPRLLDSQIPEKLRSWHPDYPVADRSPSAASANGIERWRPYTPYFVAGDGDPEVDARGAISSRKDPSMSSLHQISSTDSDSSDLRPPAVHLQPRNKADRPGHRHSRRCRCANPVAKRNLAKSFATCQKRLLHSDTTGSQPYSSSVPFQTLAAFALEHQLLLSTAGSAKLLSKHFPGSSALKSTHHDPKPEQHLGSCSNTGQERTLLPTPPRFSTVHERTAILEIVRLTEGGGT